MIPCIKLPQFQPAGRHHEGQQEPGQAKKHAWAEVENRCVLPCYPFGLKTKMALKETTWNFLSANDQLS